MTRLSGATEDDPSGRPETHRDRDRILYSEAFRRLGGVTQVALGRPELILHNRLTHSLKVEQVGLAIYSKLKVVDNVSTEIDQQAIAAACLAHDLGHPPFGHAAEEELNAVLTCKTHRGNARSYKTRVSNPCKDCLLEDGFEGNAQSFRILTRLATHRRHGAHGLDLTIKTLRATTKYPWLRGENNQKPRKWGAYDCDVDAFNTVLERDATKAPDNGDFGTNIEAEIMDWADDISYAVHDIEDFYRSGLIPLSDYRVDPESDTLQQFRQYAENEGSFGSIDEETYEAFKQLIAYLPRSIYGGTEEDHASLDRARSLLLTSFIDATSLEGENITRAPLQDKLNGLIKQLIWFHVIDGPRLSNIQIGQRKIVRELFEALKPIALHAFKIDDHDSEVDRDPQLVRRLPYALTVFIKKTIENKGPYSHDQCVYRGIVDFISSLSDEDAYYQHSILMGNRSHGSL